MGWSHNWQRDSELPKTDFAAAVEDCSEFVSAVDLPIAGADGAGAAVFSDELVEFNGIAPAHCEPFHLGRIERDRRGRDQTWSFCKTEHLPYDLVVQGVLIIFKQRLGAGIIVGSDGCDADWDKARTLVLEHLGYGKEFRLQVDESVQS